MYFLQMYVLFVLLFDTSVDRIHRCSMYILGHKDDEWRTTNRDYDVPRADQIDLLEVAKIDHRRGNNNRELRMCKSSPFCATSNQFKMEDVGSRKFATGQPSLPRVTDDVIG